MKRISWTIMALRGSSILYILLGLLFFNSESLDGYNPLKPWSFLFILLVFFSEVLIFNLRRRKKWAWWSAVVLCGVYSISLFFPLGITGLIGLFGKHKKEFV